MRKKKFIFSTAGILVFFAVMLAGIWTNERIKKAKAIQKAIANPQHIDPKQLLNEIDVSFRSMPEAEKKKLLQDPTATEKQIAAATYEELDKSFKLLFTLPFSIRERIIRESADELRRKALENPEKIAELFDSPGGNGALRGASRFFLLGLSGKQKSESAPLTEAMYEIVRNQAKKKGTR
ncbi:MAG TPA: hypothetical protein DCZ94_20635 [Lentisphaeria bacterium]|nr:MAG: hypothetical protein A2X48_01220 [Lentisphaerae bacterium GWF2_49_21]HBC89354.1 hypothetical protein [Lentisphaeria bacterium]